HPHHGQRHHSAERARDRRFLRSADAAVAQAVLFLRERCSMELKLKSISKAGIPEAISKAELYRFLNEPGDPEAIWRDILAVEPDPQVAMRLLALAITDQFSGGPADRHAEAESIFQGLRDPYERLYYTGIVHERRAKSLLRSGARPHTVVILFEE